MNNSEFQNRLNGIVQDAKDMPEFFVNLDDTLASIGLKCPECGHRIHSYFETDELKNKRRSVNRFLVAFRALPTTKSWNKYLKKRDELNKLHDKIQEKYSYLLKVENG